MRCAGVKDLATLVAGVLVPPHDWEASVFGDVDDAHEQLDGEAVRAFLVERCEFVYVTHAVRAGGLAVQRDADSIAPVSAAAKAAAAALAATPGARAASLADHNAFIAEFRKHHRILVRFRFDSILVCLFVRRAVFFFFFLSFESEHPFCFVETRNNRSCCCCCCCCCCFL